ncbi:hypothetical protein M422DRAFT_22781 [Sphaerobolus stellatus SS14]|nr:hypothetical protein M422DRAFT_22781 [Sphaerobolus stellatus SS14]
MAKISMKELIATAKRFAQRIYAKYQQLGPLGKAFVWFIILIHIAWVIFIIILTPAKFFQWIYDLSQRLKAMPSGWLWLGSAMVLLSFPPMAGYSTCTSLCGFAYGINGFWLAAPATQIGSGVAFIVLRRFFHKRISNWTSSNQKWKALEQAIETQGLPLIILIRLSPFPPYVYSQALFASIKVVKFRHFMLATLFYQSRILLSVFIGTRIAAFSDGTQRGQMDTTTKVINVLSIIAGALLSGGVGWYLYRTTQRKIQEMQGQVGLLAAEGLEEAVENIPLLLDPSMERLPVEEVAV